MLEDSISCSPGNDKKPCRARRFHKKAKRRSQRLMSQTPANSIPEEFPCLEALYEESKTPPTHYEHFNPFANEIILAAADMSESLTSRSKPNNFISQGFVRVDMLPANSTREEVPIFPAIHPSSAIVSAPTVETILGPETQFGITESEFVRFCDEVQIEVEPQPTTESRTYQESNRIVDAILEDFCGSSCSDSSPKFIPSDAKSDRKSPKAPKTVVDAILEDFCGSPYSESPPRLVNDDATPVFRFKSKSLRTYSGSRKRKPRRNIVTELANAHLPEDYGITSDSSELSVQEDFSQSVVPQLDTVDLNNSIRVCENLLSLSSYFSQAASNEKSPPTSEEKERIPLSTVVEDIMKMRRKTYAITRCKSEEEFYGFSDGDGESRESTLMELLEDEDDILQQINCDSLCYEKVVPKASFAYGCSDIEAALLDVNALIEETNKLICLGDDFHTTREGSADKSQSNCDKHKDIPQNSSQLFDDIDLWNDSECLLNYKTQKPQSSHCKPADIRRRLSSIDNNSLNSVSEKAEEVALKMQAPNVFENKVGNEEILIFDEASTSTREVVRNHLKDAFSSSAFSTAPRKPIAISEEARRKANEIFTKFVEAGTEESMETAADVKMVTGQKQDKISYTKQLAKEAPTTSASASAFAGFSTASKKPIAISTEAKRRADKFLKEFEQKEREQRMMEAEKMAFEEQRGNKEVQEDIPTSNLTIKTVQDLLDAPFKGHSSVTNHASDSLSNPVFGGFLTASRKPIAISEEAKRKADEILKKFEQAEVEKRLAPEEDEGNIQENDCKDLLANNKSLESMSFSGFGGFSTASRKLIAISDEAKRKADEILKQFEQAEQEERLQQTKDPVTEHGKLDEVSEEVQRKAQELLMDIEFFDESFNEELETLENFKPASQTTDEQIFVGFKTASKKTIQVSEDSKRRADQLLKKVKNDDLPQEFLKCLEANLNEVFVNKPDSSFERAEQVDGAFKSTAEHRQVTSEIVNKHLHADKASSLNISKKAVPFLENMGHLVQKSNKEDPIDVAELEEAFNHAEDNFPQTHDGFCNKRDSSFQEHETENSGTLKRKRNDFCAEDLLQTPAVISQRRFSCNDRTPLNRIENAILHKTSSASLVTSTSKSAFISRKNLLSLSKRKKLNSHGKIEDASTAPKTPDKIEHSSTPDCNANATPNLKEFFNSVSTSTPRLICNGQSITEVHLSKDSSIDTDFRQINWEDANSSARVCRTSSVGDPNVMCSEVSPSPKQRMERLKMYGEPPPISPILMVNKCRPSGLRRGRNLMKP